jgi:hypothetical protein
MIATQLKCRVWTASGEKKNVVRGVLRKYDVCVKYDDFSDTTTPGHNSTNLEDEISCAHIGPKTET